MLWVADATLTIIPEPTMLTLRSPAKINLFLRVLNKRADGYHEIASLFQAIDIFDTLNFSFSNHDHLTCNNPHIPTDRSNLIWKSIEAFRTATGLQQSVTIELQKNIPHEAGLGGGSSNAATALWALNELHQRPLDKEELISLAAHVGSDVPFFFSGGTAFCTGRGEKMQPLEPIPPQNLWIVKPAVGLSTQKVYAQYDPLSSKERDTAHALLGAQAGLPTYFNDLEAPAFALCPSLKELRRRLRQDGFDYVAMAGSGTSFICIGDAEPSIVDVWKCKAAYINSLESQWY
ncbi:MAG: 4-(cytidine 5'-diphospho)-2-C-methyl-D-erythritol kinase [Chlamydiales bacterium]|nr:4-(cytidine 5'-diphospho)-2-C-methyl-D-erythritol kinase [Chlamydiales bacterium]